MSEPKSPADIAVQIICIVEKYVLEDRLTAHKAAPLIMEMIVAAQKQTRRETLEEAATLAHYYKGAGYGPTIEEQIRALIEKENEK